MGTGFVDLRLRIYTVRDITLTEYPITNQKKSNVRQNL
jgi:hypothetical protein